MTVTQTRTRRDLNRVRPPPYRGNDERKNRTGKKCKLMLLIKNTRKIIMDPNWLMASLCGDMDHTFVTPLICSHLFLKGTDWNCLTKMSRNGESLKPFLKK